MLAQCGVAIDAFLVGLLDFFLEFLDFLTERIEQVANIGLVLIREFAAFLLEYLGGQVAKGMAELFLDLLDFCLLLIQLLLQVLPLAFTCRKLYRKFEHFGALFFQFSECIFRFSRQLSPAPGRILKFDFKPLFFPRQGLN